MTRVILTRGVKEYRATILKYVDKSDTVLEIGSGWGTTTGLLYRAAGKVVGIDKGESYHTAAKTYPWIEFYQIDGFDVSQVLSLGYRFNKVYIDISGCRDIYDVIKIILRYQGAIRPEIIIVKSTKLKGFVDNCQVWNAGLNKDLIVR
ncbi:MAG: class I SAM-dependent methyltransferase [Dehalococcoidales bacterium]|nr:MAG: class I SAM-dependent methyltransferase [Dehalococcoidales bacterium]